MPNSRNVSLRRRFSNTLANLLCVAAVIIVVAPLCAIFFYLLVKGAGSINLAFLTNTPKPVGETGGGFGNAIAGSAYILGLASLIGVPLGVGAGIYLSEYGRGMFGNMVRFTADVLNGVPSIVVGIGGFGINRSAQGTFSRAGGGGGAGNKEVPTITRATEEMLL